VLLDLALAAVPAPPLHDATSGAVYRWLAAATAALGFRREQLALARAVERVLRDEWRTRQAVERCRRTLDRRDAVAIAREVGTHWRERESGRAAKRPVRIDVSSEAWLALRRDALKTRTTVGEHIGDIVERWLKVASGDTMKAVATICPGPRRLQARRLYIRIAVADTDWQSLRDVALSTRVSTARLLGLIVERHVDRAVEATDRTGR
jgi:hypothetical protein